MKDAERLSLRDVPGGVVIAVKAVPGSSRDRIVGVLGDALKVTTAAPAEKGRANEAVAAILARGLGVGKNHVKLTSGSASQRKTFRISGLSAGQVIRRLQRAR